jgi:Tol biopolymer transport system component
MATSESIHRFLSACIATCALLISFLFNAPESQAQFGKNKVQYRTFDWKYIQSDHFDIYFYDSAGVDLAKFTASVAENALAQLEEHWRYRLNNRVPIIIYNSHIDFQQTNVVSEFLPEGVGGVTELFKNRVNVPFEGDWEKFRHVIHHELVHAVINDKFYGGSLQSLISNNVRFMLPIWMNEGLAEFESLNGYNIETDMFIRDAVINGYLPDLQDLNGYMAYRGGQAFYWYVEQTYGREKIMELLNRAKATGSLEAAFKGSFGKTVEEFSEQWQYDLKKIYWPDIADRKRPIDFAQTVRVTDHKQDGSYFNTSPSISPNGDRLAYISDRDRFRSVYILDLNNPKNIDKIVEGEENVDFEELHLLTPGIAWSPDSKQISLAAKAKGGDVIYVIDVESGDQEKIHLDMDAIYSVNWSPDGTALTFQGIKGDQSDIYTYEIASKTLTNLTNDLFSDYDPHWAPDNRTIYFISDRRDYPIGKAHREDFLIWNYDYRGRDIFSIDRESLSLKRVTHDDSTIESSPVPGEDGRLLYISDRNGINNIYLLDSSGESRPLTNSISGIEQLSLARDASKLVFTSWNGDGQDIFLMRMPFEARLDSNALAETKFLKMRGSQSLTSNDSLRQESRMTVVTPLAGYGDVRVDMADALPLAQSAGGAPSTGSSGSNLAPPEDSKTLSGDYRVRDYKVKFTPDFIMASGNYSSFYGVQGVTQMLFSDMLGDHQIFIATNLLLDLKNSDFIVSYYYLPEKIDYGLDLFQSSRFLLVSDGDNYPIVRYRQYGATARASNPFDRFRRLDVGLNGVYATREPIDPSTLGYQSKLIVYPSVSYVFDNSEMWAFNPISGSRYHVDLLASPKLGGDGVGFYTLLGDFRHYIPFGKGEYSIGARLSGGASFGPNPQKFFIGGVESWINYEYTGQPLPVRNAEDFIFLTPGFPLRGFNFNEQLGSKYFLGNLELRFPLFRALVSGPLPVLFQYVSGVLFLDVGSAWNDSFHATRKNELGTTVTDDLRIGTGIGARAYVLGIPLKLDVAWNYNLDVWSPPKYYISLGYDF